MSRLLVALLLATSGLLLCDADNTPLLPSGKMKVDDNEVLVHEFKCARSHQFWLTSELARDIF